MSNTIDKRIHNQMEHIISVLPTSGFALNAEFLQRLKRLVRADINLYNTEGGLIATTIDEDIQKEIFPLIDPKPILHNLTINEKRIFFTTLANKRETFHVAYYTVGPLQGTEPMILALMIPTKDISMAKRKSTLIVVIAGFLGTVVMVILGNRMAGGITTPLKNLVTTMEEVAEGGLSRKARIESEDEIGRLAHSFNSMIERLRVSEERLIQNEKLSVTGKLAARTAHEIRNPLSSIKMLVQVLQAKSSLDKSNERSLAVILSEIEKVEYFVKDLLNLSKPAEVRLEMKNIQDPLEDTLRLCDGQFQHRKIMVERKFISRLPDLPIDRDRMKQVFLNILLNSAEAMPQGGEITIYASVEKGALKVEIHDTGSGIPHGMEDKVFEPFFTTKKEGIGLGLSTTKWIIDQHGGKIQLKDRKEGGTVCEITLPLA